MTRIDVPRLEDLPPQQQEAIRRAEELMGFTANDALVMARNPELMRAFARLVAVIYGPGRIDPGLKRLIGLMTSSAAGCSYCVGHTAYGSRKQGVTAEKLAAVWEFESNPLFSAAEKAALRVAMHAGQSPNGVTDSMFDELSTHYEEDACLEIVAVIAMFGFLNRWNSTLATDLETLPAAALAETGGGAGDG